MQILPKFTGTQVNYSLVCARKLWLFSRGIALERENEDVQLGKLLGEEAFARQNKEINIDNQIVLDWADSKVGADGVLLIHEIKKSKSLNEAHRVQMLFYLAVLRGKGVAARGLIEYPALKQRETVELDDAGELVLNRALTEVERVLELEDAPPRLDEIEPKKFALCQKCAYFDFCYS